MKQKVLAFFMMGLVSLGSFTGLAFANNGAAGNESATTAAGFNQGMGIHWDYTTNIGVGGSGSGQGDWIIGVMKKFINWTLSLLGLITLVFLLWGGFQMVTASDDEAKYKKGFVILKHAGIGLGFIALSWFIVSIIFRVIGNTWAGAPAPTGG